MAQLQDGGGKETLNISNNGTLSEARVTYFPLIHFQEVKYYIWPIINIYIYGTNNLIQLKAKLFYQGMKKIFFHAFQAK